MKYGVLIKLVNITAWVLRFVNNILSREEKILSRVLSSSKTTTALMTKIKINQEYLINQADYGMIATDMSIVKDEKGVLRSIGRINEANLPYVTKRSIVLTKNHHVVQLIIHDSHDRLMHNGVRQTVAEVRATYWIKGLNNEVKRLLGRCTLCKFLNARPYKYLNDSDLSKFRVQGNYAFAGIRADYVGPFYAKNVFVTDSADEEDIFKCYVLLYTCATTRGVILDLV